MPLIVVLTEVTVLLQFVVAPEIKYSSVLKGKLLKSNKIKKKTIHLRMDEVTPRSHVVTIWRLLFL